MLHLFLVHATESEQTDRVHQFFSSYSEQFTGGPNAQEWAAWFALPFLQKPQRDPRFQVNAVRKHENLWKLSVTWTTLQTYTMQTRHLVEIAA